MVILVVGFVILFVVVDDGDGDDSVIPISSINGSTASVTGSVVGSEVVLVVSNLDVVIAL